MQNALDVDFIDALDADIMSKLRGAAWRSQDRFVEKDIEGLTPRVIAGGDAALVRRRLRQLERIGLLVRWDRETMDGQIVRGWFVSEPKRGKMTSTKRSPETPNLGTADLKMTPADLVFLTNCGVGITG